MARAVVITGPSGVGKGTLIRSLRARMPELQLSVSATTRRPRPGETQDVDYHFLTDEEFERRVAAGEFVEIERHGHTVAVVVPPQRGYLSGRSLLELLDRLPAPGPDFGSDVAGLGRFLNEPADPWQS